ncbi:hypothetical protein K438DRAFT_1831933 [Mycena galopus ATCC 62051]|nr:hypothetical protein K438DRAFT_1831933 [Mycena galopus ATCC 62051]
MSYSNLNPPLVLPAPRNINQGLEHLVLPIFNRATLAEARDEDQYEHGMRILVGLKDYVFDLTPIKAYFNSGQLFAGYSWRNISYALTKYSNLPEDILVHGYANMSVADMEVLDKWVALFLKRFEVVGRIATQA